MRTVQLAFAALALTAPALAQDFVLQRLEASPRHHEWLTVKVGDRAVQTFVAYPKSTTKATAVVVIHENRGLSDWVRGVADQLAEAGYIALAPDLLTGAGPGGGRTSDFPSSDAAREAIHKLQTDQVLASLDAVVDQARKLPSNNGKVAIAGFCWGGGQSLRMATHRTDLAAAFVFYGTFEHTKDDLARITSPVYGFYGGADERIGATIPGTDATMRELHKTFEPVTYEGAAHGFMRNGEDPTGPEADRKARLAAWERWKRLLEGL